MTPSNKHDQPNPSVDWHHSPGHTGYETAVAMMEARARAIAEGREPELVWLLEHPALYTAGSSAKMEDLIARGRLPVHQARRGGQLTYHGPGQRIAYVMLDVRRRFGLDVRAFSSALEAWIIDALALLGVTGETRKGRTGVWVARPQRHGGGDAKIAALGLAIRRGVSLHGASINVAPDLTHFAGIIPCGIRDAGVTSLAELGVTAGMGDLDLALRQVFERRFSPVALREEGVLEPGGGGATEAKSDYYCGTGGKS